MSHHSTHHPPSEVLRAALTKKRYNTHPTTHVQSTTGWYDGKAGVLAAQQQRPFLLLR